MDSPIAQDETLAILTHRVAVMQRDKNTSDRENGGREQFLSGLPIEQRRALEKEAGLPRAK